VNVPGRAPQAFLRIARRAADSSREPARDGGALSRRPNQLADDDVGLAFLDGEEDPAGRPFTAAAERPLMLSSAPVDHRRDQNFHVHHDLMPRRTVVAPVASHLDCAAAPA
jgi:hypothetical protein